MPLKIKAFQINEQNIRPQPDTPLRHTLSRVSQTGSSLKNLSQERDLKKFEKQRDSSTDKSISLKNRFSSRVDWKLDFTLVAVLTDEEHQQIKPWLYQAIISEYKGCPKGLNHIKTTPTHENSATITAQKQLIVANSQFFQRSFDG